MTKEIKGIGGYDLMIGEKRAVFIPMFGKEKVVNYSDLSSIKYALSSDQSSGEILLIDKSGEEISITFNSNYNEDVSLFISDIRDNYYCSVENLTQLEIKKDSGFLGTFAKNVINDYKRNQESKEKTAQKQRECAKDKSVPIHITFGNQTIGIGPQSVIRQKIDGTTYFNYNDNITYKIIGYEWGGPIYQQQVTTNTTGRNSSKTVKKGKTGRMTVGAVVGQILIPVPGVGAAVGAAVGAGGKSKSKTEGAVSSNSKQISKQIEQNSKANLKLQNNVDGSIHSITVVCNSDIDAKLRCLQISEIKTVGEVSKDTSDALKGIKALKELLDMGAITEEEFDIKKSQLLNL